MYNLEFQFSQVIGSKIVHIQSW